MRNSLPPVLRIAQRHDGAYVGLARSRRHGPGALERLGERLAFELEPFDAFVERRALEHPVAAELHDVAYIERRLFGVGERRVHALDRGVFKRGGGEHDEQHGCSRDD